MTQFILENTVPAVNFVALLLVLFWLQRVRRELDARTERFERIDRELADLKRVIDGPR